jgi:hypothetical protein
MSESGLIGRRPKETVPVSSPFPGQASRHRPRWFHRIRGVLGMSAVVIVSGIALALLFGLCLLAAAILMATAFS